MSKYEYGSILKTEISSFIELRKARGLHTTCATALSVLDKYLLQNQITDKALSYQVVDSWISESYQNLNPNTVKNYTNNYIQFAKYLKTIDINAFVPITSYYKQTYTPYIFSESEMARIIETADNLRMSEKVHNSDADIQIPLLLRILYGCGLRLSEALHLKRHDIDFEKSLLWVRNAKSNSERIVPMDKSLHYVLFWYFGIISKCKPDGTFLFEGLKNNSRRNGWALVWFQRVLKEAGINMLDSGFGRTKTRNICLNCLRHTFAVSSLRQQVALGIDIYRSTPLLSIYLGHSKLSGTMKYMHMTAEISEDILSITQEYTKGMFPEVPI